MDQENTEPTTENNEAVEAEANEQAEPAEQTETPEITKEESDARSKGWTGREEWEAAGKDPDDWVNYKHFNRVGSLISEVRHGNKQHKGDIENLQKFQKMQLESMKTKLEGERTEAVSMADEDAFNAADKQLNDVNSQLNDITAQQAQSAEVLVNQEVEWMSRNSWFNIQGTDEQSMIAKRVMTENPSVSGYAITDIIDAEIAKAKPTSKTNANRERPSPTSKAKPAPQKTEAVTLDSMTKEETTMINAMKNFNPKMTDADVLRLLKNSRG